MTGDLNSRIGSLQSILLDGPLNNNPVIYRQNLKIQYLKIRRRKVLDLYEIFNFEILKGRMLGDSEGESTYISHRGTSVIDFCYFTLKNLKIIKNFKVLKEHFSDHMQIHVKFVM